MNGKTKKILFHPEEIAERVGILGEELTEEYRGRDLVVVSLLRGSFIFTADLVRAMDVEMEIDFVTTSSYENRESSDGNVNILHDLRTDISGRDVLLVDDICDSGHTMFFAKEHLAEKNPKTIKTCCMLDKPDRREVEIFPDFIGFTIPDLFIVGYGLNFGSYYRNVPYIYAYVDDEEA